MLENAVIKEYETSDVRVMATEQYKRTPKTWILHVATYVVLGVLFYVVTGYSSVTVTPSDRIVTALVFGIVFGSLITFMLWVANVWMKQIPVYSVGLEGKTGTDYDRIINRSPAVVIVKTTGESDQAEVCKAAQQLEPAALQFDRDLRAIKQIADKCK